MDQAYRGSGSILAAVGVREAAAHLGDDGDTDRQRKPLIHGAKRFDQAVKVAPVQMLHGDVVAGTDLSEIVDLDHIGVIQVNADFGFVDEHPNKAGILRELGPNPLDNQLLLESRDSEAPREENLRHSPGGDPVQEFILSEGCRQLHGSPDRAIGCSVTNEAQV